MLKLARLFSHGMVLQREKPVKVWGKADAGAELVVSIQGVSAKGIAGKNGAWQITLPPLCASCAETLTVQSNHERISVEDVAVGEVWIAGGQSNMEFPLRYEKHREDALKINNSNLRFFDVPEKFYEEQDQDFDYSNVGIWRKADAESLPYFSAVGFYFQKELAAALSVPVGIIGCNWGGTQSCAWMREETVRRVGAPWMQAWEQKTAGMDMDAFWEAQRTNPKNNCGNPNTDPFSAFIMPATPTMEEIACFFQAMMEAAGVPADEGSSTAKTLSAYQPTIEPKNKPGILFRNMVEKTAPYTVRGIIWYQGESDDEEKGLQSLYGDMIEGLIGDWRDVWQDQELPFFQVQLPGWSRWMMLSNHDYAAIRRGQEVVTKRLRNVYMASISDIGEELDIHPKDKKTVGHRLAGLARHYVYGEDILCEAPRPQYAKREGNTVVVTFQYAGNGLKLVGKGILALEVVQDGNRVPYTAEIEHDKLILSLKTDAQAAVALKFAQGKWYQVNLYNSEDIPTIPFTITI